MPRIADPHARVALQNAARAVFSQHGIHGARIEDITQKSGLSKGAFYLHYESKEALFEELVKAFITRIDGLVAEREQAVFAFIEQPGFSAAALSDLEAKFDQQLLEAIWDERDVFMVLFKGAQGTRFESVLWELADKESRRVEASLEKLKKAGACRQDVPSEVFGAMAIGTYLMVAQRMCRLQSKPNLELWVRSIQKLINEGVQ